MNALVAAFRAALIRTCTRKFSKGHIMATMENDTKHFIHPIHDIPLELVHCHFLGIDLLNYTTVAYYIDRQQDLNQKNPMRL